MGDPVENFVLSETEFAAGVFINTVGSVSNFILEGVGVNAAISFLLLSQSATTFGTRTGATPTTVEEPIVVTSRRCYINVATGTAYTVPAGAEVRFNDTGDWLAVNGTTPAGAKFWRCRGESSTDYSTDVTLTPTLGGVDYPFTVRTMAEPVAENASFPYTFPFNLG